MRLRTTFLLLVLIGCSPYVHSPPGRSLPLETPKALNPRETGVQVEGGGTVGQYVHLAGATLRVRHGLVKGLDGNVEGGFERIRVSSSTYRIDDRWLFTGRIGFKYAPIDHFAIRAGVAGGGWTGGGFVSPDVSLIAGYENPYCVPFIDLGWFMSIPTRESLVTLIDTGSGDGNYLAVPATTMGWTLGTGVRVPLSHSKTAHTKSAVLVGFGVRGAYFDNSIQLEEDGVSASIEIERDSRIYFVYSVGFEWVFGPGHLW
jgi:hypothetical protein